MKQLNEAKSVLFDPIRREEHKVRLRMRRFVTPEELDAWRKSPPADSPLAQWGGLTVEQMRAERANAQRWSERSRKRFYAVLGVLVFFVISAVSYEVFLHAEPQSGDPIAQIIERHRDVPMPLAQVEPDTMTIPDTSLVSLKRKAEILFNFAEYRSASKYMEKILSMDSTDEDLIRQLSIAYFKRGKYARSLEVLSRQMHGDSNLVVTYYNIGQLFMREEKPFDARNAFEEAVHLGKQMQQVGKPYPPSAQLAEERLASLH
jgi:tetratricopeptide (TPR) repeat protein